MFLFLACWILSCAAAFFILLVVPIPTPTRRPLTVAMLIATVARLVPLAVFRQQTGMYDVDIEHYHIVAEEILHWRDAYVPGTFASIHPYLPLQMYIFALADWASGVIDVPFFTLVRDLPPAAGPLIVRVRAVYPLLRAERREP